MGSEVDPAFIQDPEHRPDVSAAKSGADHGVPLIDLSARREDGVLAREIGEACEEWGFFQVINHGVAPETRRRVEDLARRFFAGTVEEKRKVRRDERSALGYYDTELTKNVRDWKEVLDVAAQDPTVVPASPDPDDSEVVEWFNRWPDYPPELREACEVYTKEVEKLAFKLMELIAMSLGLPPKKFHGHFNDQTTFMRLNHYPPCPFPHLALGVGRHKDAGALTVLAQDEVGGLEVKNKKDGQWIRVEPTPDAFIINVGDIFQVWSNDKYESVEHRVMVNSERERFSVPFFFNPAHDTVVEPAAELVDHKSPPKFRAYGWGKFMVNRGLSNFKKLNVENLQAHHFKLQP